MKKTYLLLFIISLCVFVSCKKTNTSSENSKIVLAYVTSWSSIMPDPDYVTHINYAFGHVNETLNGVRIDNEARFAEIVKLKKQKSELKIMLSIGGWGSGHFSEMASTEENRKSFAKDCKRIVDQYKLDGIDMDWEYPTSSAAGISSSNDDTENFNLLMQDIRNEIGKNKLLTLASAASGKYYDFSYLVNIINFINVMMYDVNRPPFHHSAIYRSELVDRICAEEAINAHITAGFPVERLVLGVPFYGHGIDGIPDYIEYKDLVQMEGYTEKWDDIAKVPYLANPAGEYVCAFDNPESLTLKCKYALERGMLGVMYWEYACDDPEGSLRKAVFNGIMN